MGVVKSLAVALAALPSSIATQTFQNSGTSALLMQHTFTPGYTGMPSSLIWLEGNQLNSGIVSGNYHQPNCSRSFTPIGNIAIVSAGEWHKVIIQAKWASDSSGYYKMWFDNNKVYEHYNIATITNDDYELAFRVGLYANGWHDDSHQMKGNQGFRQVWYDEVAVSTTFKDVDPDQYE
ncbi:polysaccharide lyase [Trichoderma chlorosporum]